MGARCGACGKSVMPYRAYLFYSKPTATCTSCGAHVRLRGFWGLVAGGAVLLAALFATVFFTKSIAVFFWVTLLLVVLALGLDYGGYRLLRWDPDRGMPA